MRALLDFFVRLFGGVTDSVWNQLLQEALAQRAMQRNEIDYLRACLELERSEAKQLRDLIFKKFGFIVEEPSIMVGQALRAQEPIKLTRESWPRMKSRLERQETDKFVAQQEEYWRSKGAEPVGEPEADLQGNRAV